MQEPWGTAVKHTCPSHSWWNSLLLHPSNWGDTASNLPGKVRLGIECNLWNAWLRSVISNFVQAQNDLSIRCGAHVRRKSFKIGYFSTNFLCTLKNQRLLGMVVWFPRDSAVLGPRTDVWKCCCCRHNTCRDTK